MLLRLIITAMVMKKCDNTAYSPFKFNEILGGTFHLNVPEVFFLDTSVDVQRTSRNFVQRMELLILHPQYKDVLVDAV
jgi:hypothetical protein